MIFIAHFILKFRDTNCGDTICLG